MKYVISNFKSMIDSVRPRWKKEDLSFEEKISLAEEVERRVRVMKMFNGIEVSVEPCGRVTFEVHNPYHIDFAILYKQTIEGVRPAVKAMWQMINEADCPDNPYLKEKERKEKRRAS